MKADWVVTTALSGALTMTQAFAADLAAGPEVPAAVKAEPGPWQVRLRGIYVLPEFSNRTLTVNAAPLAGARIGVTDSIIPELDITYYFTKNIAAELILAVTRHTAYGAGSIAALGSLGRSWLLPPTLTLQYHFTDFGAFKPYIGGGINYTWFFNTNSNALSNFSLRDNVGYVAQFGFDYALDDHWGWNVDVKRVFLLTTASGNLGASTGPRVTAPLRLDPWLIGTGLTYRF